MIRKIIINIKIMKNYYFDQSATSSPKPDEVIKEVIESIEVVNGNSGRSANSKNIILERKIYSVREKVNNFFGGKNPLNIAFSKNATESLNQGIRGLNLKNCHIITSFLEHNSVLRSLNFLKEEKNISLSYIKPSDDEEVIEELSNFLRKDTKLLVINHMSNVTGYIFNLEEIGKFCKENNIIFMVDASQSAGCIEIDIEKFNIDILCFTGHKSLMGIQGIGGIYVDENIKLTPLIEGGTGSYSKLERHPQFMPELLEAGTLNAPGIFSLGKGIDYIEKIGLENIKEYKNNLTNYFLKKLKEIPEVIIYGDVERERGPVISINIKNLSSSELGEILNEEFNISVRTGFHCAPLAHKILGTYETGSVRFSFGYTNTEEEIDYIIESLKQIKKKI